MLKEYIFQPSVCCQKLYGLVNQLQKLKQLLAIETDGQKQTIGQQLSKSQSQRVFCNNFLYSFIFSGFYLFLGTFYSKNHFWMRKKRCFPCVLFINCFILLVIASKLDGVLENLFLNSLLFINNFNFPFSTFLLLDWLEGKCKRIVRLRFAIHKQYEISGKRSKKKQNLHLFIFISMIPIFIYLYYHYFLFTRKLKKNCPTQNVHYLILNPRLKCMLHYPSFHYCQQSIYQQNQQSTRFYYLLYNSTVQQLQSQNMFTENPSTQRASRVAVAGSIYMRRASVQNFKPKQTIYEQIQPVQSLHRNAPCGKIVKNGKKAQKLVSSVDSNLLSTMPKRSITPLLGKQNLLTQQYTRKTATPSFGHFEDIENVKIKVIQEKYRAMLSNYEQKKKAINNQLTLLKNTAQFSTNSAFNQTDYLRNTKQLPGREYQSKNKQFMVEKHNKNIKNNYARAESRAEKSIVKNESAKKKQKQKITDVYPHFFRNLRMQVKLEQQLRNMKAIAISKCKEQIEKIFVNQHPKYLKLLELDPQQYDPFENLATKEESSASILAAKLIKKYEECENFWKQTVCSLSPKQAKDIFSAINFEKAQEVSLKSFVREISFLLEKHLRNRDLLKIYQRLTPFTENEFSRKVSSSKQR